MSPVAVPTAAAPTVTVCGGLTQRERLAGLFDIVITISGPNQLRIPTSAQFAAFEWLVNNDQAQVCPDDELDVKQRYVGAVLYFSTQGDNWLNCNSANAPTVNACPAQERYLSSGDICGWFGSECNDGGELIRLSVGKYKVLRT
jgi:hypothetical protein